MAVEVLERPALTWEDVKRSIGRIARERGEWAGIPLVVQHLRLTLEPKYPWSKLQNATLSDDPELPEDCKLVNSWISVERGYRAYIFRDLLTGETFFAKRPLVGASRLTMVMETLSALPAWSVEAELRAQEKLGIMLANNPSMFKSYLLTGTFFETSKRSGVSYFFRRLRPTVALKEDCDGGCKVLACLCLHPIGFYAGTFAGVMVPTDCVVAHLSLMRGDERRYWAMSNQHHPWEDEAGI